MLGRQITGKDRADIEKSAFAFFKHKNIGNLVLGNSKIVQELGISNPLFHALKVFRGNDKEIKKLSTDWEKFFTGPIFSNRMKKIIKETFDESLKHYETNKKVTKKNID